eukprot:TRINITY_DN13155_c0_g1_i2.p1 TRINITY_DN13155_c0_g1~~TRINITY_DN13155_c0_g1_i2.p1  ORF type:complete len:268 (+),score=60.89 TRINITY_DN13155_c0_g1_i2:106-909(+)
MATRALAFSNAERAALERVILSRYTCKKLKPERLNPEHLKRVLALTQRAPTSFNSQPYKVVIVQSPAIKELLSAGCAGPNVDRVKTAPAVAVFAGDMEVLNDLDQQTELMLRNGAPEDYAREGMHTGMKLLSSGWTWPLRPVLHNLAWAVTSIVSMFKPGVPVPVHPQSWAVKQTMLAVDHFVLAATAHGMGTSCMEGFNEAQLREALNIPSRYHIPCIVAVGYPESEPLYGQRYNSDDVFREDNFSEPFRGILPLVGPELDEESSK